MIYNSLVVCALFRLSRIVIACCQNPFINHRLNQILSSYSVNSVLVELFLGILSRSIPFRKEVLPVKTFRNSKPTRPDRFQSF